MAQISHFLGREVSGLPMRTWKEGLWGVCAVAALCPQGTRAQARERGREREREE